MENRRAKPAPAAGKPKLHGRAFYESIGSPKFIVAPMVDQSEFAWRMLTRSYLAPSERSQVLAYSPMMHARLFADTWQYRKRNFQPTRPAKEPTPADGDEHLTPRPDEAAPAVVPHLDGNALVGDRPLFVQFCANDASQLLSAALQVAAHCDAVDLNLGCPQGIARKGRYGAFLQEDQPLIARMIRTLHESAELGVPVTAKMRILETREATLAYARLLLDAGASAVAVHGRRREMKGHLTGRADWAVIRHLRDNLPPEAVLFANGNVLEREDLQRCLEATGADAVMSAEGNLANPALFAEPPSDGEMSSSREYWRGAWGAEGSSARKGGWRLDGILRRYLDILHVHVLGQAPPTRRALYLPGDGEDAWVDETLRSSKEALQEAAEDEGPKRKKRKGNHHEPGREDGSGGGDAKPNGGGEGKKQTTKPHRTEDPNLAAVRSHLFALLRHLVARHTDVRDALSRVAPGDVDGLERIRALLEAKVAEGLREYERTQGKSWEAEEAELDRRLVEKYLGPAGEAPPPQAAAVTAEAPSSATNGHRPHASPPEAVPGAAEPPVGEQQQQQGQNGSNDARPPPPPPKVSTTSGMIAASVAADESSLATVRACRRPWWIAQPYVRPLPNEAMAIGAVKMGKAAGGGGKAAPGKVGRASEGNGAGG